MAPPSAELVDQRKPSRAQVARRGTGARRASSSERGDQHVDLRRRPARRGEEEQRHGRDRREEDQAGQRVADEQVEEGLHTPIRSPEGDPPEEQDHAEEEVERVVADVAGGGEAADVAGQLGRGTAPALIAPSMTMVSTTFQQNAREPRQRPHDQRVVDLVDVVLVDQQACRTGKRAAQRRSPRPAPCRRRRSARRGRCRQRDRDGEQRSATTRGRARARARRACDAGGSAITGASHVDPVESRRRAPGMPDPAGDDRADGEDPERDGHRRRRLVQVVLLLLGAAELPVEGQEDRAEHVERGDPAVTRPDHAEHPVAAARAAA